MPVTYVMSGLMWVRFPRGCCSEFCVMQFEACYSGNMGVLARWLGEMMMVLVRG